MAYDFVDSGNESTSSFRTSAAFDFVKGFITGQIALLSLLFFIVRFLFFRSVGPVAPSSNTIKLESSAFIQKNPKKSKAANLSSTLPADNDPALLERLFGLDHQALKLQASKTASSEILISDESARWLTFLLSKIIFDPLRAQIQQNPSAICAALQEKLNLAQSRKLSTISAMKNLETIQIKSIGISNFYPSIDSYQLCYDTDLERCVFRIKCSWQDAIALEIESAVNIVGLIALPFSISIKLKNLRFTAQLQASENDDCFVLTCLPDDNLLIDLEVGSLVGHRTKLKDLPKIKNGIVDAIKKILSDTVINPKGIKIPSPDLLNNFKWPIGDQEDTNEDDIEEILLTKSQDLFKKDEDLLNSMTLDPSISEINEFSLRQSMISDESEPMNVFLDSRYEDDFEDNIEPETFVSTLKAK